MATVKDDGGNAFPALYHDDTPGMTLRDWFAGQALSALIIANKGSLSSLGVGNAKDAYRAADAMLEVRAK